MSILLPNTPLDNPVPVETVRSEKGRFMPTMGRDAIYDLVKDVALIATDGDLGAAEKLTTLEWDAARADRDGTGLKTASAVTKALGMEWADCLHVSLLEASKRAVARAARLPGEGRDTTEKLIVRALKAAAYRYGETPTPDAYDRVIEEIEAERKRKFDEEFGLPSSRTIRERYDSWDDACRIAALDPPVRPEPVAMPQAYEVFMDCVRETGCVPGKDWFYRWTQIRRRFVGAYKYAAVVEQAREAWEADGGVWPAACPRKHPLPEEDETVEGDRQRWGYWTDERILDALRRYIAYADGNGMKITQRHYRLTARDEKHLDLPAASQLTKRGKLAELMKLARDGKTEIV